MLAAVSISRVPEAVVLPVRLSKPKVVGLGKSGRNWTSFELIRHLIVTRQTGQQGCERGVVANTKRIVKRRTSSFVATQCPAKNPAPAERVVALAVRPDSRRLTSRSVMANADTLE